MADPGRQPFARERKCATWKKKNMLMRFWKKELPNMTNGWAKAGFSSRHGNKLVTRHYVLS
jgi:hypothetical protein